MTTGHELKAVLGHHPFGISVVTVDLDGERLGLTIASLTSLSLDPPLVGVSVARQAALHELLRAAGGFAVSLLASDQVELAQHFARGVPPIALWHGIELREGKQAPLLENALGWLECTLEGQHPAGDHTIFVGRVTRAEEGTGRPALLRLDGEYRST